MHNILHFRKLYARLVPRLQNPDDSFRPIDNDEAINR